jgi:long-chain acyl-CoA synthetase
MARKYRSFADFTDQLGQFGDRVALTTRPFLKVERVTYQELRDSAYRTAHYLTGEGLKPGDRIIIIGTNGPQWISLFLGAQLAGVIVVTVDTRSNFETARKYAEQTKPKLVFKNRHLMPEFEEGFTVRILENLYELTADQPTTAPKTPYDLDTTALIVFTSGTTAEPKGVVLTQGNILSNVVGVQQALDIDPNWRLLSVLPLSHMYELTGGCLAPLSGGTQIFYLPRVTPLAIARGLHDYHITTILAVPQLLILFLQRIRQTAAANGQGRAFETAVTLAGPLPRGLRRALFRSVHEHLGGSLDMVVTGGAPIPQEVARVWERMGVKMVQGYGLTETSPVLAVNNPKQRRLDSQGRVLGNIQVRIAKNNREIQARGPSVFRQYWHNTEATKAAFTSDGWFKTGDIGRITDGWLQIQGREKFTIVLSSGLKVFPEDIENVTSKEPTLTNSCIVGVTTADGEQVHAVIISKESDTAIDAAITAVNDRLEPFQHIAGWTRWTETDFPRTRLLKVDRRAVQAWANKPQDLATQDEQKASGQDPLVGIIRLALDKPGAVIKLSDRLADIGLDSLRRLVVVSLIEEQLSVAVAEGDVTDSTTVAELRDMVEQGRPAEATAERSRWPFRPWVRHIGNFLRETLVRGILRIWIRQHTEGSEHLQKLTGPAIYIFNHVDDFDAPVLYKALPRTVRRHLAIASADDVFQQHRFLAFIARLGFAAFNFARHEPYMPSLEYLASLIDQGWNVALSPEGRISPNGKLMKFKTGIGLLAVELGVPVVPVKSFGLTGTVPIHSKWPKKHSKVTVRIGEPVSFDKATSYDVATKTLHDIMERL